MVSSTGIGVSVGRWSTIRTILSSYIRLIGCVVVGCEKRKEKVGFVRMDFWWGNE